MSEGPFYRSDKKATEFREWLDSLGGVSEKLPDGAFRNSERSTGVSTRIVIIDKNKSKISYSVNNEDVYDEIFVASDGDYERFSEQVDAWLNRMLGEDVQLEVGRTPEVLKQLGVRDLPIVMSQNVLVKITGGKHSISLDEIKRLPDAIADPIMVFNSNTVDNAIVILTELETKDGETVLVALHLDRYQKLLKLIEL